MLVARGLGINTIYDTEPWMMELGVSEEDAKKYTRSSNKNIVVKCPDCGCKKNRRTSRIYSEKSISCNCADGVSYPEKFMYMVLKQVKIGFQTQYSPEYLERKKSDFYISSLKLTIETDGALGHEGGISFKGCEKDLAERVAIDKWKDEQHLLHGIKTIRINCFESNMEYIRENILKSELVNYFDFSSVDWEEADYYAFKSNKKKEVCEYKKNNNGLTNRDIGSVFGLSSRTIASYLKFGNKYGWCDYDAKTEMINNGRRNGKLKGKQVAIFKDGVLIGLEESVSELDRISEGKYGVKLFTSNIFKVCLGKQKHHKGFTFKYIENEEEIAS